MNPSLVGLPALAGDQLLAYVLVLGRIGALFVFAPIFSSTMLPPRVRAIAAGALALALTPLASRGARFDGDWLDYSGLLVKEIVVGLAIAFAIGIVATAIQAGAAVLDTLVGFSFAQIVDPFTNVRGAVLGQLYAVFATIVLLLTGGDHLIVEGIAASYRIVPLDAFPQLATLAGVAEHGFVQVFVLGLEIAAPVAIAIVVTDAAFGLIARAVPQMNVFVVALPAKVVVALALVAASLPFVSIRLQDALQQSVLETLQALR